jgi:predicted enzyme related to lactoylglutathione lyase
MITPRETVVHAEDFEKMVEWYHRVLDLKVIRRHEEGYQYCNLENESGIRIGITSAKQMGVNPTERKNNTVVLQFQVPDVKAFFEHLQTEGSVITFGPSFDEKGKFWFGGAQDIEGNPFWVVDENCT